MDKTEVITKLREHEPELKAAGISHVHLFGSTARGEATPASDIDLMVDFDGSRRLTLFGITHIQNQLTDLLGHPVDLSSVGWMHEHVRVQALSEAILAF